MIRTYRPEDLPTIMDIGNRAWRGIYKMFREAYGDELFECVVPDETTAKGNQIKAHCEQRPEWVFICEEDGRIVGFVTFRLNAEKKIGEIGNNAVDPDYQGRGIGSVQYAYVLALFCEEGMAYAMVGTGLDEAHAPARAAYDRVGFELMIPMGRYYRKL